MHRSSLLALAFGLAVLGFTTVAHSPCAARTAPERGEPVRSMGLPQRWKPQIGAMLDWDRRGALNNLGAEVSAGVYRDLGNPLIGFFGWQAEGYASAVDGRRPDGGVRLLAVSRFIGLGLGADYSARGDELDFVLSFTPWLRRGGPLRRGDDLRIAWYPGRNHSWKFGLSIPIWQPYSGKTRPPSDHVRLPSAPRRSESAFEPSLGLETALDHVAHAADWINRYTTPFFDQSGGTDESHIAEFLDKLETFKQHFHLHDALYPAGHGFAEEIRVYHRELERAFALAAGDAEARTLAHTAREVALDEVILPYNRLLGQRKTRDSLRGLAARAEDVFGAEVEATASLSPADRVACRHVFRRLLDLFEANRAGARAIWDDSRFVWIPLHYALRLDDHDTQKEVDALIERALGKPFTAGNRIDYVMNELFHLEINRMIKSAEDYHVLWIHDYRGVNNAGEPDKIAFGQTLHSYLAALTERVREYDATGRIPTYMIFLDEFFYELNQGWLFLALLEDPLHHQLELPPGHEEWEAELRRAQDELESAVAESRSLQAGREQYGEDWLRNLVKVHVNITNPQDHSFRSNHVARGFFWIPDVLLRDHRKISFYDVTELDPGRGEALFTGVGVGEHYAGPTWEDRSLLARGPAVLGLKAAARELLLSQGFTAEAIPPVLRPLPKPSNYDAMVRALEQRGWNAHALHVHNATGYGPKPINLVKGMLYELMPAGSHLYVPDSLWNSALWAGMLAGAALRGCEVFVISPSVENAPSSGRPQMSRANEIFTRFVVIQNTMGDDIRAGGGRLRTGVYDLDFDIGDLGRTTVFMHNLADEAFLRETFPFDPSVYELLEHVDELLLAQGIEPTYLTEDTEKRKPLLHLKTQFFISDEAVSTVIPLPAWRQVLEDYLVARAKQLDVRGSYEGARALRAALSTGARELATQWAATTTAAEREHAIFYFTIGSHNQDYRGKVMDGEVLYVTSGPSSMNAYLDFVTMLGFTTWVESIEELEELIPRESRFWRGMGRLIRNAL